ncbi:uncharacterized protein PFL1_02343 [Pseudozyma flocculosa PF-1]|uniref:uncharacterized protein n=1 Tax=Pseudozyma flocculosa PF-1 TaxID=1277687 RepID=UPI0004560F21|nr:uncharacterized protein PFL1_02343 [Pseudozyma flocculosa PF-1]EPQ30227.1 hypothetical protein PFL1_02343 [Pseudozyma flocculosa PF-1]
MPICTTCSRPVDSLFVRYGKDHVVLARCTSAGPASTGPRRAKKQQEMQADGDRPKEDEEDGIDDEERGCGAFADPYLEHGLAIVLLDLMLVKPRAYRHLLFNRPTLTLPTDTQILTSQHPLTPPSQPPRDRYTTLLKRLVALLLIDAYIRWFYLCVHHPSHVAADGRIASVDSETEGRLCTAPLRMPWGLGDGDGGGAGAGAGIFDSYVSVLLVTAVEMVTFHLVVGSLYWAAIEGERWSSRRQTDSSMAATRSKAPPAASPTSTRAQTSAVAGQTDIDADATDTDRLSPSSHPTAPSMQPQQQQHQHQHRSDRTVLDLYTPDLAPTSMLLSQLSTLLLLSLVLLWDSKFPRPPSTSSPGDLAAAATATTAASTWLNAFSESLFDRLPAWSVEGTIRAVVGGLSAGVALGVIVPHRPAVSTLVLLTAWSAQAAVARWAIQWIAR